MLQQARDGSGCFAINGKQLNQPCKTLGELVAYLRNNGVNTHMNQNLRDAVGPTRTGSSGGRRTTMEIQSTARRMTLESPRAAAAPARLTRGGAHGGSVYLGFDSKDSES